MNMNVAKTLFSIGFYAALYMTAMLLIAKVTGVSTELTVFQIFSPLFIFAVLVIIGFLIALCLFFIVMKALHQMDRGID